MSEPVAIPVEAIKEAISSSRTMPSDSKEAYLDDSTQNHLSYKATNGTPYLIDYLGLKDFYNSNPAVTQMARDLHEILVDNDTEVTINQTKEQLDALSQELNLQENDAPFYKLKKLLFLAKIRNQIAETEKNKLNLLEQSQLM